MESFVGGSWILCADESAAIQLVDVAVARAQHVSWPDSVDTRYRLLSELVASLEVNPSEFAAIDSLETGVPLFVTTQVCHGYAPAARAFLESAHSYVNKAASETLPGRYGRPIVRHLRPVSPAVVIAPWNVPFGTILPKIFVAWLCGCAVLIKPSEFAYRGICAMIRRLVATGILPDNAVQVLVGGPKVGAALCSHPSVGCVQFTGASATATKVLQACAATLRPFHAECGGSNAAIVGPGADMDLVVRNVAMGLTTLNGQWCMGLSRILVHRPLMSTFLHRIATYMNHHVKVVDPTEMIVPESDESILVGRLVHRVHAQTLLDLCERCKPESTLLLGEFPPRFGTAVDARSTHDGSHSGSGMETEEKVCSAYFQPRLLLNPDVDTVSHHELFGPVAGVIPFDSMDEAVDVANLSSGQLACYVFGGDVAELYRIAPRLKTGMVMINSLNFAFEVDDGCIEPRVDFHGTAGHGRDGNGEALASFFSASTWVGVNGRQQ